MTYMLEWRLAPARPGLPDGIVSHVRMFRTIAALKAFVRSRTISTLRDPELRVTLRTEGQFTGSVMTTRIALLAWDGEESALPAPLGFSRWERDLRQMATASHVTTAVCVALETARCAELLSPAEARDFLRQLDHLLRRSH